MWLFKYVLCQANSMKEKKDKALTLWLPYFLYVVINGYVTDSTSKAVPEDAKVYVNLQMSHNHPSS